MMDSCADGYKIEIWMNQNCCNACNVYKFRCFKIKYKYFVYLNVWSMLSIFFFQQQNILTHVKFNI